MQILILLHLIIMELCGLQDKVEYMEDCFQQQEQWKYLMHLMVQDLMVSPLHQMDMYTMRHLRVVM